MKIARLTTRIVDVPFARPIQTAIHEMRSIGCVLVELKTADGLIGQGYLFTLNAARLKAFHEMVIGFADLVVGQSAYNVEAIWQNVWREINPTGHKGVTIAALSAIDTACWDLIGKSVGLPLHKLFGACRDRIATYASGGLWLSQTPDDCAREAAGFVDEGFVAVKLRIGSTRIAEDVLRARLVREAIGPDVVLMVDANQSLTPKHAIRLGRMLEPFDIAWFEEPVPYHDLLGHADVRRALDVPIATGETEYTRYGIRQIIEARAADVLMPDLQRIGGLSEFRRVCALAAAYDLPVSTHIFTEHSLCIAGSQANCMSVEHMPWTAPILNEPMDLENGELVIPDRPGTGFTFNEEAVARFALT